MNKTVRYPVIRYNGAQSKSVEETMIYEYPLNLLVNGIYITTFTCTPEKLKALVIGFMNTKGIIDSIDDIETLEFDEENGVAKATIISHIDKIHGRPALGVGFNENTKKEFFSKLINNMKCKVTKNSDISIEVKKIYDLMKENLSFSEAFKETGGAHSIALCDREKILFVCEDVARHNAVDKVIGEAIIRNITFEDKILLISGRVSFEMVLKTARTGIPIVISKSAPTSLSIELAKALNITLIGFVRGENMVIYTNHQRVK